MRQSLQIPNIISPSMLHLPGLSVGEERCRRWNACPGKARTDKCGTSIESLDLHTQVGVTWGLAFWSRRIGVSKWWGQGRREATVAFPHLCWVEPAALSAV